MDPATASPSVDPDRLLSGFIGLLLLSFSLYGALTIQTYIYRARFPTDPTTTKSAVYCLWFLETAHTILSGRVVFYYSVFAIKNPSNLLKIDWSVALVLWLEIGIVAVVQGSYIRRIWILSEKWWLLTGIAVSVSLPTNHNLDI
ncbi:hypothetical protein QCA50_002673 [Cerrena zonata]|uniref:Uncharacterized protein n=1 Tax=Cerrena zonata TaxID=2478898 RepID=A0AAW0GMH2_9APHY